MIIGGKEQRNMRTIKRLGKFCMFTVPISLIVLGLAVIQMVGTFMVIVMGTLNLYFANTMWVWMLRTGILEYFGLTQSVILMT
jgi:hypothetical protein